MHKEERRSRSPRKERSRSPRKEREPRAPSPSEGESSCLHVSNLTRNVTAAHLEEIFGMYGSVKSAELAMDRQVHALTVSCFIKVVVEVRPYGEKRNGIAGGPGGSVWITRSRSTRRNTERRFVAGPALGSELDLLALPSSRICC